MKCILEGAINQNLTEENKALGILRKSSYDFKECSINTLSKETQEKFMELLRKKEKFSCDDFDCEINKKYFNS